MSPKPIKLKLLIGIFSCELVVGIIMMLASLPGSLLLLSVNPLKGFAMVAPTIIAIIFFVIILPVLTIKLLLKEKRNGQRLSLLQGVIISFWPIVRFFYERGFDLSNVDPQEIGIVGIFIGIAILWLSLSQEVKERLVN